MEIAEILNRCNKINDNKNESHNCWNGNLCFGVHETSSISLYDLSILSYKPMTSVVSHESLLYGLELLVLFLLKPLLNPSMHQRA